MSGISKRGSCHCNFLVMAPPGCLPGGFRMDTLLGVVFVGRLRKESLVRVHGAAGFGQRGLGSEVWGV